MQPHQLLVRLVVWVVFFLIVYTYGIYQVQFQLPLLSPKVTSKRIKVQHFT